MKTFTIFYLKLKNGFEIEITLNWGKEDDYIIVDKKQLEENLTK